MIGSLRLDIRHAARSLRRAPTMTGAAIACIALGIGATTSIYAAVHTALVRPLPLPAPEELIVVYRTTPHFSSGPFAPANFLDLRRQTESVEHLAAVAMGSGLLEHDEGTTRVSAYAVSGDFFPAAGVRPILGRLIGRPDEDPGTAEVAVLSEEIWRERFGADPGIIGQTLRLDGEERTVVGVLPSGFRVPQGNRILTADVWTPLRFTPNQATLRRNNYLLLIGRLTEGRSPDVAHGELRAIMSRIIEANPVLEGEQLRVLPLHREAVRSVRTPLFLLLGAVGFVLLIAAANLAGLLLARGAARRQEWAVRTAIGASAADVLRGAVVESMIITAVGAVVGLFLAFAGVRVIASLVPSGIPQLRELGIDPVVVGIGLAVAVAVGLVAGVAPAWQAQRTKPQRALSGYRAGASRSHQRFLRTLVVVEVALSLVLLVGAGLVIRGFTELVHREPGFDPEPLLTLQVTLPPDNYADVSTVDAFVTPAFDAIRAVPGAEQAAYIHLLPYEGWGWNFNIRYEGQSAEDPTQRPLVENRYISPSFFETLEMTLLEGRRFEPADEAEDAPAVVVANRALAERDFPGESPVGERFHLSDTTFATIVGVVDNIRNFGPDRPPQPEVYWSIHQSGGPTSLPIIVRTAGDPARLATPIADAIRDVDPDAAIGRVRTMNEVISTSVARPRFYLALLGVFAAVALVLAMAGLYGVVSYAVTRRTREIGIRAALGSAPADLLRMVLRGGMALVGLGAVIGLAGSWGVTGLLDRFLYGVSPFDPAAWAVATLGILGAGVVAILVPASRAARVNPVDAIRLE